MRGLTRRVWRRNSWIVRRAYEEVDFEDSPSGERDSGWFFFNNRGTVDWSLFGRFSEESNKDISTTCRTSNATRNAKRYTLQLTISSRLCPRNMPFAIIRATLPRTLTTEFRIYMKPVG
ncbi:hypothetical protein CC80DRAFT_35405 [Byssothecium circinans]|uniref:Uncharacterized protein n=1 Tax=Byssothecium circinans TaxID=147558 RepID=A0A6A5TZK9_9PLEO|nr:hypothetical protein CC80DRAFT_35405 [Byssothecium circinans]